MDFFRSELEDARKIRGGTTVLVKGPPGVGKTALLARCGDIAREAKWLVAGVHTDAFYDVGALKAYLRDRLRWLPELNLTIRVLKVEWEDKRRIREVLMALGNKSGGRGLLLVLDEAQHLLSTKSDEHVSATQRTLHAIHNGELGAPVVLLAGGLGHSRIAFEHVGISRFDKSCCFNLGPLSPESARAVIRDWLVKDGRADEGASLNQWIEAIAMETHGWPQHIIAFVDSALHHLASVRGNASNADLAAVLAAGRKMKRDYYQSRVTALKGDARRAMAALVPLMKHSSGLTDTDITAELSQWATQQSAETIFNLAVQKGLLAESPEGDLFAFPIPSMCSWLVETYGHRIPPRR